MRGIIGLVLAGLGAFLILVAVLLPTWVVGQVLKFPLSEYETATLEASNASYFSVASLREKTGVTLRATYTIKGDASAGNSSTAVWNQTSDVYDLTNHRQVQQMTRRFAFDRRTGQLVDCCGASVNGDKSVRQTGLVGYVFPIGTQKQTYQVFDTTLKKTMPFVYSGTTTVDGIGVYEFVENVAPTQIATVTLPGSYVHSAAATVTHRRIRRRAPDLLRGPGDRGAGRRERAAVDDPAHQRHRAAGPGRPRRRPDRDARQREPDRRARPQRAQRAHPGRDHPAARRRDRRRRRAAGGDLPQPQRREDMAELDEVSREVTGTDSGR